MEGSVRANRERLDFLLADYGQGFIAEVGYRPTLAEPGRFDSRLDLAPRHLQQDGFAHAGVVATMADHTAGYAAFTTVPPDVRILTVEFKINFLRPAAGDSLVCRARVLKPGKRMVITEAEVFAVNSGEEVLAAKALLTMAAVPRASLEGRGE